MENELVLRLNRDELFNPMILAPHSELNPELYEAVLNFVKRYRQKKSPRITIYTDTKSNIVWDKARELFREHFEDEYEKLKRTLRKSMIRQIILSLIAVICIYLWVYIFKGSEGNMMLVILGNTGVFCLWELLSENRESGELITRLKHYRLISLAEIDFQTISTGSE